MYGTGYPGMPPPPMHRALQAMEAASGSAQEYTGKYSQHINYIIRFYRKLQKH